MLQHEPDNPGGGPVAARRSRLARPADEVVLGELVGARLAESVARPAEDAKACGSLERFDEPFAFEGCWLSSVRPSVVLGRVRAPAKDLTDDTGLEHH